jgi:hypothetical protein
MVIAMQPAMITGEHETCGVLAQDPNAPRWKVNNPTGT